LLAQLRIIHEALIGEITDMEAHPWLEDRLNWWGKSGFGARERSRAHRAHQSTARADALLWDVAQQVEALPSCDRAILETRGFPLERLTALVDSAPAQGAFPSCPSSKPLRDAVVELAVLEQAILDNPNFDPYR
jgi:hypothetical protein